MIRTTLIINIHSQTAFTHSRSRLKLLIHRGKKCQTDQNRDSSQRLGNQTVTTSQSGFPLLMSQGSMDAPDKLPLVKANSTFID